MPQGPVYTKTNYRTVDTGTAYLIKTAWFTNHIATLTAGVYSPALIFNLAQGTVDQFSLYLIGQTRPVIPLMLVQKSVGTGTTKNYSSSIYSQLDHTLAWVQTVPPTSFKVAVQAVYQPSATESNTFSGGLSFLPDFLSTDFITPATAGTIFPFSNGTVFDAITDPVAGQTTAHFYPIAASYTDTNIYNYIAVAYAELQS